MPVHEKTRLVYLKVTRDGALDLSLAKSMPEFFGSDT